MSYRRSRSVPLDQAEYIDKPTVATEAGRRAAAGMPPTPGTGMAGVAGTLTRFPATFVPPPTAIDFSASASAVVGPGPVTVELATFTIPRGSVGVVRSIVFNINNMLVTTIVSLALTINQGLAPGWRYTVFPRAAASVALSFGPEETYIKIPDGALIGFSTTLTDAGTNRIGGTFHGWHFSKTVAMQYGISGI